MSMTSTPNELSPPKLNPVPPRDSLRLTFKYEPEPVSTISPASTSSVIGMLEPVLAGVFAWIWLEQSWNGIQLLGAAVVLVGIYIADRARSAAA